MAMPLTLKPHLTTEERYRRYRRCRAPPEKTRWRALHLISGGMQGRPSSTAGRWLFGLDYALVVTRSTAWRYMQRLGFTLQVPRPRHRQRASEEEQATFKKSWATPSLK
jgi:hypothetical protein